MSTLLRRLVPSFLLVAACASVETPPTPTPDPMSAAETAAAAASPRTAASPIEPGASVAEVHTVLLGNPPPGGVAPPVVGPTAGAPAAPSAWFTPEITADQYATRNAYLSSDEFEGRESGTRGGTATEEWVASELARMGLEPCGEKGTPFSTAPMPFRPFDGTKSFVGATLADGTTIRTTVAEGSVPFGFSSEGFVQGPLVFAGYGLAAEDWNDWSGVDVRGKVALVIRHGPREQDPQSPWFARGKRAEAMSFAQKVKNAAAAGASAVLLVNDQHHKDEPVFAQVPGDPSPIPLVTIRRAVASRLLAPLGKELSALEKSLESAMKPDSRIVPGVTVAVEVALGAKDARSVLFVKRGTDPALRDEAVVLGAHLDHVGFGWFGSGGRAGEIHNGADDNASGTAALLEIAEAFAAAPAPRRSVVFAAWCGEEKGLVGSAYWCDHPTWPLANVVANVNLDMVGRYRNGDDDPRFQIVGGPTGEGLELLAHDAAKAEGLRPVSTWEAWEQSDHFSFYQKKIPVLFLHSGLHPDYHKQGDDWWKVNADGGARISRATASLVRSIADLPARPAFKAKPPRPILGVQLADADTKNGGPAGARLAVVFPGGPAAKAGLKPNDVVTAFAGTPVADAESLGRLLGASTPGAAVEVTYRRGAESKTTSVTIGAR